MGVVGAEEFVVWVNQSVALGSLGHFGRRAQALIPKESHENREAPASDLLSRRTFDC